MTVETMLVFAGSSCLLAFMPGPDILAVLTRSIAQGRGAGIVSALGFASGVTVHTTAAALGLALVLRESPTAFLAIQYAGAAYLLYLAVRTLLSEEMLSLDTSAIASDAAVVRKRLVGIYWQSVLMNVLNPKVTLAFLAYVPRFVDVNAGQVALQFVILGAIFAACTVLCFGTCAVAAAGISTWLRRTPGMQTWIKYGTAAVFLGLVVWILWPR